MVNPPNREDLIRSIEIKKQRLAQIKSITRSMGAVEASYNAGLLPNANGVLAYTLEPIIEQDLDETEERLDTLKGILKSNAKAALAAKKDSIADPITVGFQAMRIAAKQKHGVSLLSTKMTTEIARASQVTLIKIADALAGALTVAEPVANAVMDKAGGLGPFGSLQGVAAGYLGTKTEEPDIINFGTDPRERELRKLMTPEAEAEGSTGRRAISAAKGIVLEKIGVPADPVERQAWYAATPTTAKIAGHIANLAIIIAITKGVGSLGAGSTAAGNAGLLSRVSPGVIKGSRFISSPVMMSGISGGAIGAFSSLGFQSDMFSSPENIDGTQLVIDTLSGIGGGVLLGTALFGRPFGAHARAMNIAKQRVDLAAGRTPFNKALMPRFRAAQSVYGTTTGNLGAALSYSARDTVGYHIESGLVGVAVETSMALGEGKSVKDAIIQGARNAPAWIAGDIMASKMGSMVRWGGYATAFQRKLHENIVQAFSGSVVGRHMPGALVANTAREVQRRGSAAVGATNVVGGAAFGAAVAASTGADPMQGAIVGGVGGAALGTLWARNRHLLPKSTLKRLELGGDLSGLSVREARLVSQIIVGDAALQTAALMDPASAEIFLRAMGRGISVDGLTLKGLARFKSKMLALQKRVNELAPNEVMPDNPEQITELIEIGVQMHRLREMESQFWRNLEEIPNKTPDDVYYPRFVQRGMDSPEVIEDIMKKARATDRMSRHAFSIREGWTVHPNAPKLLTGDIGQRQLTGTVQRQIPDVAASRAGLRLPPPRNPRNARTTSAADLEARKARRDYLDAVEAGVNQAGKKVAAGRKAAREAERQIELQNRRNEIYNERMTTAYDDIQNARIEDVYDEIAAATGETAEQAARRLGEPNATPRLGRHLESPAAREELAYLRGLGADPSKPITKRVKRRTGTNEEARRELRAYENMFEEIDNLLAKSDAGGEILPSELRGAIKGLGGSVEIPREGFMRITLPMIGTIEDFIPAALRRVRLYLKDFKPALILAGAAATIPLSEAGVVVRDPGFMTYQDNETGEESAAFFPSLLGAAALATIGMMVMKHSPITMKGFMRRVRHIAMNAGSKDKAAMGTKREIMFALTGNGDVSVLRGTKGSVSLPEGLESAKVVFSLHNHPYGSYTRLKLAGIPPLIYNTLQQFPSDGDLRVHRVLSMADADTPTIFAIVNADGRLSVIRALNRKGNFGGVPAGKNTLSQNVFERARNVVTEYKFLDSVKAEMLRVLKNQKLVKTTNPDAYSLDQVAGMYGTAYGARSLENILQRMWRTQGIDVTLNVQDSALERALTDTILAPAASPSKQISLRRLQRFINHPVFGTFASQANDPTVKAKLSKLVTGTLPKPRKALRRKGPVKNATTTKALIPDSITEQATTQPVKDIKSLRAWAEQHDLRIGSRSVNGETRLFAVNSIGQEIAEGKGFQAFVDQIRKKVHDKKTLDLARKSNVTGEVPLTRAQKIERTRQGGRFGNQRGSGETELVARLAGSGGILGGFIGMVGGSMADMLIDYPDPFDTDSRAHRAMIYGSLGLLAGAFLGATAGGFSIKGQAKKLIQIFIPDADNLLKGVELDSTIKRRLGKSDMKESTFVRLPEKDQLRHLNFRLQDIVNKSWRYKKLSASDPKAAAKEQKQLIARFTSTLRKYAPVHIPNDEWDNLMKTVIGTGEDLGLTKEQAYKLYTGMIVESLIAPWSIRGTRHRRRFRPNLMTLAEQKSPTVFGPSADPDHLRSVYYTADLVTGPPGPMPAHATDAVVRNYSKMLSPDTEAWVKMQRVAASTDQTMASEVNQYTETLSTGPFGIWKSLFRSPEMFREVANRLLKIPEKAATGQKIMDAFMQVNTSTINWREDAKLFTERLHQVLHGIPHEKLHAISEILQKPELLSQMAHKDRQLYQAALEWRSLIDEIATDYLGIPRQGMIEDYFPWIYNSKTLREMKAANFADPDRIFVPRGVGYPEHAIFKRFMPRSLDEPIGPYETNAMVVGQMYIAGAVRKKNLDIILSKYNAEWFEQLHSEAPFVASDMARWVMDIAGVPTRSALRTMNDLRAIGISVESLAALTARSGLPGGQFLESVAERYFTGHGAAGRLSNFARGFEFYSKIGANLISPVVNLTQLANTLTDVGYANAFLGTIEVGIPAVTAYADEIGKTGANMATRALGKTVSGAAKTVETLSGGWINPNFQGKEKLKMLRSVGLLSDNSKRLLDEIREEVKLAQRIGPGSLAGAASVGFGTGLIGGVALNSATGTEVDPRHTGLITGGLAAMMVSRKFMGEVRAAKHVRMFRKALSSLKETAIFPFSLAETVNRGITGSGAYKQAAKADEIAARVARNPKSIRKVKTIDATEKLLLTGTAGAALGAGTAPEGERAGEAARVGAIGAAVAGMPLAFASRNAPRFARVVGELDTISDSLSNINFRGALKKLGPPTREEVYTWYMRQVLDQTQFRFGREARPQIIRSTMGEIAGSLQSFTLNQIEFMGSRLRSFWDSVAQQHVGAGKLSAAKPGEVGAAVIKGVTAGELDVRIFRYVALAMGAAGALTAASMALESDKTYEYWMSRIGFGLMPLLSWNTNNEMWQLNSPGEHLMGPFIGDVLNATQTFWELSTNPVAFRKFDEQIDDLAYQTFTIFRQTETNMEATGRAVSVLQNEGLTEMFQGRRDIINAARSPFSSLIGTASPPRGASRRAPEGRQAPGSQNTFRKR